MQDEPPINEPPEAAGSLPAPDGWATVHEMTAAFEKKFGYRPGITMSNARTFYAQVRKALETGDSID